MKNARGKTPSLLSQSTGKPHVEVCKRKSNCTRCAAEILMGASCFKIPKAGNGFTAQETHCVGCCRQIIDQTKKELQEIEIILLGFANS